MPARNAIGFLAALAIYAGALWSTTKILNVLGNGAGPWPFLLLSVALGFAGYFIFAGSSRAVLVFLVCLAYGLLSSIAEPLARHPWAPAVVFAGFGFLAAIATNVTEWLVHLIKRDADPDSSAEAQQEDRSTVAYRLGRWLSQRVRNRRA